MLLEVLAFLLALEVLVALVPLKVVVVPVLLKILAPRALVVMQWIMAAGLQRGTIRGGVEEDNV